MTGLVASLLRLASLAGVVVLLAACGEKAEAPAPIVRPVLSIVAHQTASQTIGPYVGTIASRYETPLSFQTSGRIIARPVEIGDLVTKGQLLASLDASVQQYQLASAEANLASAQSQFNNLAAAEERARSLVASGASAQAQLDAATSASETAGAQLAQARASLARAQDQLGYTKVTAGFDGVVVSVGADIGQVVGAGQTIVTIAQPDVREAVFDLPEALATGLKPDIAWKIAIVGAPGVTTTGSVREVSPLVNASTRSQRVKLTLPDPPEGFRLGATVEVSYDQAAPASFTLPMTALLDQDGKSLVWVVDPKTLTVSTKLVAVGARTDDSIAVTNGLIEGDRVVTAGVHSLTAGQAVKLVGEGS
jgi:RND family efflux transporter MFP subunit